jgi:hypothetical protein
MGYAGSHTTGTTSEPKRISYRRLLRIGRRLCRLGRRGIAHGLLGGGHDVLGLGFRDQVRSKLGGGG